jgi:maltooligosyltrehalose trehalohydrolase
MNKPVIERRTLGVNFNTEGTAELLYWVPEANSVAIRFNQRELPLFNKERGYWALTTNDLQPGMTYQLIIDGQALPDICSLSQPDGVHGASLAITLNEIQWTDDNWLNPALDDYLIYEIHTGTFTPEGTFNGIIQKLDHLKGLGITAIEIMPVAQFPGERNWGYDGVFPFAVQHSYGGAAGLQRLVDACHTKGLAVILDVVFNHIGPEGNYLEQYGPYFTDKYKTPWGNALNFDDACCDEVRRYFMENALMWFRDFHIDALRLDAVHAIKDFSPRHFLKELKEQVDKLMQITGRTHYLIVECDLNDRRLIDPLSAGGYGMDAQWSDEFHHSLRVCAGEKRQGYYSDFNGLDSLKAAYDHAYVYYGQYSDHRNKSFGTDPVESPGKQFVVFSQNHDQVGNRMLGERSAALFSFEMQKLMVAAVMISPFLPMLFMGEEYSEPNPFLYFVSHSDPELISAVSKGRKAEFAAFHDEGEAPDPQAEATFLSSKLQWDKLEQEPHQTMFRYYQALIRLRKTHPALSTPDRKNLQTVADIDTDTLIISRSGSGLLLYCVLNFSKHQQSVSLPALNPNAQPIFNSAATAWNGPSHSFEFNPENSVVTLQPESILIIEQHV